MENNEGMEFKDWLRAEMEAKRLNPSDLARLAKVPQPTIFRILSGETKDPRTGTVKRIERALGMASPPITDEHTEQYDVVAEFAMVYSMSTDRWRTFLKTSIQAAKNALQESGEDKETQKRYK